MKIPKQYSKIIDEIMDEPDGSYFVYLKKPYAFEPHVDERAASHCSGMYLDWEQIEADVKNASICPCSYCQSDE